MSPTNLMLTDADGDLSPRGSRFLDFLTSGGVLMCDANWQIKAATDGATVLLGWQLDSLRRMRPGDLLRPSDRHRLEALFVAHASSGEHMEPIRVVVATRGGELRNVEMSLYSLDENSWAGVKYAIRVCDTSDQDQLLTRLQAAEQQLDGAAVVDPLTGLANYPQFELRMMSAWRRASKSGAPVSLVLLSIHGLRDVNRQYGQTAGDQAIMTIAHELQSVSRRAMDASGRLGHQLLAALLPDTSAEQLEMLSNTLRGRVAAALERIPGGSLLQVDIGFATSTAEPGSQSFGLPLDTAKASLSSSASTLA